MGPKADTENTITDSTEGRTARRRSIQKRGLGQHYKPNGPREQRNIPPSWTHRASGWTAESPRPLKYPDWNLDWKRSNHLFWLQQNETSNKWQKENGKSTNLLKLTHFWTTSGSNKSKGRLENILKQILKIYQCVWTRETLWQCHLKTCIKKEQCYDNLATLQ